MIKMLTFCRKGNILILKEISFNPLVINLILKNYNLL